MSLLQYKGVTISLISRSDIRYVGILDDINQETSSIALINVRSCGTEDRKQNPDEKIPPQDNIFPYICFRASDVKDLVVEQDVPPPKPPTSVTLHDPAIINYSTQPNLPSNRSNQASVSQTSPNQYSDSFPATSQNASPTTPSSSNVSASNTSRGFRSGPTSSTGLGPSTNASQGPHSYSSGPRSNTDSVYHRPPSTTYRDSRDSHYREPNYQSNHYESRYRSQRYSNGSSHSTSSSSHRGFRPRRYPSEPQDRLVPQEEFDFETSNAKFHKEDLVKELETLSLHSDVDAPVVDLPVTKCYDRKASFFDNISCEAKERAEKEKNPTGSDMRKPGMSGGSGGGLGRGGGGERKLNMQTFGSATVEQLFPSRHHHHHHHHGHHGPHNHHPHHHHHHHHHSYSNTHSSQYYSPKPGYYSSGGGSHYRGGHGRGGSYPRRGGGGTSGSSSPSSHYVHTGSSDFRRP